MTSVPTYSGPAAAEDGLAAWLRYARIPDAADHVNSIPSTVVALSTNQSSPVYTAGVELKQGLLGILGKSVSVTTSLALSSSQQQQNASTSSITVGTFDAYTQAGGAATTANTSALLLQGDGFWLDTTQDDNVLILSHTERGALYGTFTYLAKLAQGNFTPVAYASNPNAPVRWVNQWDNLDSSIERGYAGASIFFADGVVRQNLSRVADYARLLASVGINGLIVNNVNADENMLNDTNVAGLGRIADIMRPYGVQAGISLNFASPNATLGTFDPLDPAVQAWWTNITDYIYQTVPDLAGFLVKGDSEGQPGPLSYNRTLAEGANLFARPTAPYGGVIMYRAFVYNDELNETDWYADRAKAAVDYFQPLDGQFDDNVVVQIKYGPIDFQVREPTSPLFANLVDTNVGIELEVAQEYLGQQCHLVYLPPLWKTVLDFDLRVDNQTSLVRDIVGGRRFNRTLSGSAAVVNVGMNATWLGSHLAMSNLYGYGRLAWDPALDPEPILQDWIRLTFSSDDTVVDTLTEMSMLSWPAYENYTGNLGIQTLTNILGNHYGPKPQSQDGNGYCQWTRAGPTMVGMDRTVFNGTGNGTGYSAQYPPQVYQQYEDIATTPDDLLLWFHHVPWTQPLHSGTTVIQHFYDAHYAGAQTAQDLVRMWRSLEGRPGVDPQRYGEVLHRQVYQAGHALVWRDSIVDFYYNMTSLPDAQGRVMHHPYRIEAEDMTLDGYEILYVEPFEAASGYKGIMTTTNDTAGTATALVSFDTGVYDLAVNYFDVIGGRARWEVFLGNRSVGSWVGDMEDTLGHAPSQLPDESAATRITFTGVSVTKGEELKLVGTPEGIEAAFVDYVSFLPQGIID
ncbi:family 67 glycoside hydrolase [Cryphonectria parasitica EP155]|uniref:Alpha-glucuronidase n=1 Tax=Cryphonectria parasitica (strain ATCC 38755 / EP155) TaxID=660469 RepID=A0A9P4XYG7_CRYP1|nr:family 67 glycoside hydrolase [Cryphonectria parasitica EP155]KAF3763105.1 family 67 glycoside hydrolase [Cryphonectria parasitica EP155]